MLYAVGTERKGQGGDSLLLEFFRPPPGTSLPPWHLDLITNI